MKIGVIITSYGSIDALVYHNHLSVLLAWKEQFNISVYHLGDNQQETSLNVMTVTAIEDGCDYLFFLEHDNIYEKDTLQRLIAHDKDIVSGYYTFRNYPYDPIPLHKNDETGLLERFEFIPHDGLDGLKEVTIACFGCCLVKKHVFEKIAKPFRREHIKKGNQSLTVDVVFFRDASEKGIKIFVDGNVRLGHIVNSFIVTPDNHMLYKNFIKTVCPSQVPLGETYNDEQRLNIIKSLVSEDNK